MFACVSLVFIATVVGAAPRQGRPLATNAADDTFIVAGTLVRGDKTPIEGIEVMIAEAKDTGYAVRIGEGGVLQNPRGTTDSKGRFSITVQRSLFKDRQEFVVVVPFFGPIAQPMRFLGDAVAVKIDESRKEYRLGELARENSIIR